MRISDWSSDVCSSDLAIWQGRQVYAFTKAGDSEGQDFARSLGCMWAGSSDEPAPAEIDAAIIFAPVGALVPAALRATRQGGQIGRASCRERVCLSVSISGVAG